MTVRQKNALREGQSQSTLLPLPLRSPKPFKNLKIMSTGKMTGRFVHSTQSYLPPGYVLGPRVSCQSVCQTLSLLVTPCPVHYILFFPDWLSFQITGLGQLKPNVLVLGCMRNWQEVPIPAVKDSVNIL